MYGAADLPLLQDSSSLAHHKYNEMNTNTRSSPQKISNSNISDSSSICLIDAELTETITCSSPCATTHPRDYDQESTAQNRGQEQDQDEMNTNTRSSPQNIFNSNISDSSSICLIDTEQTDTVTCSSPYATTLPRDYDQDSSAQSMGQEQDQGCMLANNNCSLVGSWSQGNTDQTHDYEYRLHPYQQCPNNADSQTNSHSLQANTSYQQELLKNYPGQNYKPCSCCHSNSYSGQIKNNSVNPQSPSSWDATERTSFTNPAQDPAYSQEAGCSFKVVVIPPQKQDKSPLCCKECGQLFTKESNLKKHVERLSQELDEPSYKCKYCNHVFKSKEARKRHHPVHKMCMTDNFARVRCSVCGFKFSSKEKLQHHLHRFAENSDERIFKCFFCSHAFTTDFSRNRHEGQMHTGPHKLPCCCCGKLFANRYKLKLHRLKQQIQRPPRCQDCGWVFAAQEYLDDHMRQVKRNLPLECLVCHHKYQSQLALLRHLKFHTRKMEHECPSCLGRFPSDNLLTKHLRTAPRRVNVELHQSDGGFQQCFLHMQ